MEIANSTKTKIISTQSKIILSIFSLESDLDMESLGVSSTGMASLVNRITFRENKKDLIDRKFIKAISKRAGRREFTYYKTTTLGQIKAIKEWIQRNETIHRDTRKVFDDDDGSVQTIELTKYVEAMTDFKFDEILQHFYQKLPKLKKYSKILAKYSMMMVQLEKESLKTALFDLRIKLRSTYGKPHTIPIRNIITDAFTNQQTERLAMTQITDYVESVRKQRKSIPVVINAKHELLDGFRRLYAAKESGLSKINSIEIINEYGVEVNFKAENRMETRIIKYFRIDDDSIKKMYDYILDSLTFIFLRNLKTMKEGNVGVGKAHLEQILNDPDLTSFYQQYKMEKQQDLQDSLNLLSDYN